jgi:hypothetical protein
MLLLFEATEIFESIETILNSFQKYQNYSITTVAVYKHGMGIERGRASYKATKAAREKDSVVRDDVYGYRGNTKSPMPCMHTAQQESSKQAELSTKTTMTTTQLWMKMVLEMIRRMI